MITVMDESLEKGKKMDEENLPAFE